MNSWSQHVPKFVAVLGLGLLIYSMLIFFRPPTVSAPAKVTPHTPPRNVAPSAPKVAPYQGKTWDKVVANRTSDNARVSANLEERRLQALKMQQEAQMAIAKNYLSASSLKMKLPEDYDFTETRNEGMRVLIGMKDAKPEFYLVSGKQKMTADQARAEMEDQMGAYGLSRIKQDTVNNRSLGPTTQFKGVTNDGQEFQAIYFYNSATGNSHMLYMMDKDLSRQPARTRQIFDSVEFDR